MNSVHKAVHHNMSDTTTKRDAPTAVSAAAAPPAKRRRLQNKIRALERARAGPSRAQIRHITPEAFATCVIQIRSETGRPQIHTPQDLVSLYNKFAADYPPGAIKREWSAHEHRGLAEMLKELGFKGVECVELNQMLPEGTTMRDGSPVEEANVLLVREWGQQLGINMDLMYQQLEARPMDTVKWSRRANEFDKDGNPTNGKQNKNARHNCCITDAQEAGTPIMESGARIGVRSPHPKNAEIEFTFYAYEAFLELKKYRERCAQVLGPFGYKVTDQYHELNKYYDKTRGIGRHGDIERGPEHSPSRGMVNCLKVGFHIPMLFSWYKNCQPAGAETPLTQTDPARASFPIVPVKKMKKGNVKWSTNTVAAVFTAGHGDYYQMSAKAVGKDWKRQDWALRHCAGASKYTGLPKAYYTAVEKRFNAGGFSCAYSLTGSDRVENDSETPELQSATKYDGM